MKTLTFEKGKVIKTVVTEHVLSKQALELLEILLEKDITREELLESNYSGLHMQELIKAGIVTRHTTYSCVRFAEIDKDYYSIIKTINKDELRNIL